MSQHPILASVGGGNSTCCSRRAEGEVLLAVGEHMRRSALTLPASSLARADLLESASDWILAARLCGARAPSLRTA